MAYSQQDVTKQYEMLNNIFKLQEEAEDRFFSLEVSHAKELYEEKIRLFNKEKTEREALEVQTRKQIMAEEIKAINELNAKKLDENSAVYKKELEDIRKKYAEDGALFKQYLADNEETKKKAEEKAKRDRAKAVAQEWAGQEKLIGKKKNEVWLMGDDGRLHKYDKKTAIKEAAEKMVRESRGTDHEISQKEAEKLLTEADKSNSKDNSTKALLNTARAAMSFVNGLNNQVQSIGTMQGLIDTRLQGSTIHRKSLGSVWRAMEWDVGRKIGISPIIRQETLVENLKNMVGQGISFDVEQRAFLQTISEKIATTFEATDGTLLKLVRIQQADTTAARLGMESALTAFLNNMYETTEYMQSAAKDIRANLYEASALMSATSATEFEYQVQKWMGSLYSVGFSKASELSGSLGKLAAGDISGITDGGTGNLLVMAANRAGLSITDALQDGLDASETNQLMQAAVEYLGKIYNDSQGSKVIQQQFAKVYGLSASDLKAAANLANSTNNIARNGLDYGGMITQLKNMTSSIYARTSTGEMLNNALDNFKYTLAGSIGANPALFALWNVANMLDETVSGIEFGIPTVMGNGMASQTFRVSDIMKLGTASTAMIPASVKMLAALGNLNTNNLLKSFGISDAVTTATRGTGEGLLTTQMQTLSESATYAGNEDSSDVQNKAMTDTKDSATQETASAVDDSNEVKLKDVNENVVAIYQLLNDVATGTKKLHVDIDGEVAWTGIIGGNPGTGTIIG